MDTTLVLIFVAAVLGGIVVSILGWLQSSTPWNPRTFAASVITAIIGGAGITALFNLDTSSPLILTLIGAFLSGAGVDAGRSRIAGILNKPGTAPNEPPPATP